MKQQLFLVSHTETVPLSVAIYRVLSPEYSSEVKLTGSEPCQKIENEINFFKQVPPNIARKFVISGVQLFFAVIIYNDYYQMQ